MDMGMGVLSPGTLKPGSFFRSRTRVSSSSLSARRACITSWLRPTALLVVQPLQPLRQEKAEAATERAPLTVSPGLLLLLLPFAKRGKFVRRGGW